MLWPVVAMGQIQVDPASAACNCDGLILWNTGLPAPVTYTAVPPTGGQVLSGTSATSTILLTNMCPTVFALNASSASGLSASTTANVPIIGFDPGQAAGTTICSTSSPITLSQFISNFQPGGSWSGPTGLADNGVYNAITENPGLFTYSHTIGGCLVSTGVLVDEITNSNAGMSTTYLICDNYAPFFMTSVLTGNPQPNGTWNIAGGAVIDGWFNPATMNTSLFTYTVPGVSGCENVVSSLYVIENQMPNPGVNTTILVCEGAAPFSLFAQLNGNPDTGGSWFTTNNTPIPDLFDPSTQPAGAYRYRVSGQTPCTAQEAILTIGYTSTNPSGENGSTQLCQGAAAVNLFSYLGGSPMNGGQWTGPGGQSFSGLFDPQQHPAGNYSYYYPNVGCTPSSSVVQVNVLPQPVAGLNQTHTFCTTQANIPLNPLLSNDASSGGQWTLAGQPIANPWEHPGPGNYTLLYTVGGGVCPPSTSAHQVIIDPLTPVVPDVSDVLCTTSSEVILADYYPQFQGLTFSQTGLPGTSWDPGENVATVFNVLLSGNTSCPSSSGTLSLTPESPAFDDVSISLPVCEADGFFSLEENGVSVDYGGGFWVLTGEPVSILQQIDFSGERTYEFISQPGQACSSSILSLTMQVVDAPNAGMDAEISVCSSDAPVDLNSLLSSGVDIGAWYLGGFPYAADEFNPSGGASVALVYRVEAAGDCPADEAHVTISVSPQPVLTPGNNTALCAGSSSVLVDTDFLVGYNYIWNSALTSNPFGVNAINVDIPVWVDIETVYPIQVTATNGICTASATTNVTVHPIPVIQVNGAMQVCEGQAVELIASGATNYSWNLSTGPTVQGSNFVWTASTSFDFTLQGWSSFGCSAQVADSVLVHPLPFPDLDMQPVSGCAPLSHFLTLGLESSGVGAVSWLVNGQWAGDGTSVWWTSSQPGWYDVGVMLTSPQGCEVSYTLDSFIHVRETTVADFEIMPGSVTVLNPEVQLTDFSTGAASYWWTLNGLPFSTEPSPTLRLPDNQPGVHTVCLRTISIEGCPDSTCKTIPVRDEQTFFAPNAFTPDNDGINDYFRPYHFGYVDNSYLMRIYDRWGILIFETGDPEEAWIGNVMRGNHFAPVDVYTWIVEMKRREGAQTERFTGHVTLIR